MSHEFTIELWNSEKRKDDQNKLKRVVRWACSCGRIGNGVSLDGGEHRAWKRAQRGGDAHVRRHTP